MAAEQERQSEAVGVLQSLDGRKASGFYWYLTVLACVGGFLFGYDTSVVGSVLNFIPYKLSDLATGYLVAGASLGAAAGAICAGPLTDRFGRKSLLIIDALIFAIGALLSAFTVNAAMLIISRTLVGLAVGADSAIATAYIAEFAPAKKRGSLSIVQQWMITVGILVSYLIALLIFAVAPGAVRTADWRLVFGLGAVPAIIAMLLRARMPESPRWLLHRGRYADTQAAFGKLGIDVTEDQVRDTAEELERQAAALEDKRRWTPGVVRALIVVCVFFIFQQITGINVPFYYGPKLLAGLFQSGGAVNSAMSGLETAAILGTVNVIATFFAFRYIDRLGRRKLALGGFAGMVIFMVIAAAGVAFLSGGAKIIVVMVGFGLFIASFAIGVGGTGWLIQGEVFPTSVRGQAAAGAATVNWLSNFAIVVLFPTLNTAFGLSWVMILLAFLSLLAVIFVAKFLPETKNLSVEQVVHVFERQQQS